MIINRCFLKLSKEVKNRQFYATNALSSLGFIGTGKISQAIILGLINKSKLRAEQVFASDANPDYLDYLKNKSSLFQSHKVNFLHNNNDVLNNAETILLCVKPKDIIQVVKQISPHVKQRHLVLSIAAGIPIAQLEKYLPSETRVIRVMTNITALVQQSCSVLTRGKNATDEDAALVKNILESIGTCEGEIDENQMDVVTALSGSGPAYLCLVLDALADGGVKMGLSREFALRLACQTMLGTSHMITQELKNEPAMRRHLMQIKEEVCSPGGTTIHGVAELENRKVRAAFINCVEAATIRAKELKPSDS